ncbi:MAG: hypothetical protein BWX66_01625 [Deltaproteobacteria bacterium ADurb.Bin058]|nr:MAG: hypothetical protein BWX66_01625 [Deltaproteobacteria bacterium ADurb.Bin058]
MVPRIATKATVPAENSKEIHCCATTGSPIAQANGAPQAAAKRYQVWRVNRGIRSISAKLIGPAVPKINLNTMASKNAMAAKSKSLLPVDLLSQFQRSKPREIKPKMKSSHIATGIMPLNHKSPVEFPMWCGLKALKGPLPGGSHFLPGAAKESQG